MQPPMTCPRCQTQQLHEIDRDGITLDKCERCRGLWLDRGELEKLQLRGDQQEPQKGARGRDDDDDNEDDRRVGGRRGSFWDIFD